MAPEQVSGRRGDHRADIYSVGAMLYEMTTGRRPYDEQPDMYSMMKARLVGDPVAPRLCNPALSEDVEEVVLRALAREPGDRYQTAAEFRADLERPERVMITGRAQRLKPVRLGSQARDVLPFLPAAETRGLIMSLLTAFGLFAVTAMLVTYALEERSHWFILAFAGSCALGSTYGFLQGAWPF